MPIQTDIISSVFAPQIRGFDTISEGTSSFKSTFEYTKARFDVRFFWYADPVELQIFDDGAEIKRTDGKSFFNDGLSVGDSCRLQYGAEFAMPITNGVFGDYTFNITGISEDGFSLFTDANTIPNIIINESSVTPPAATEFDYNAYKPLITGLTSLTAARYSFGLNENSESFNVKSKLTGEDQAYLVKSISGVTASEIAGIQKGWASNIGNPTIENLARSSIKVFRGPSFGSSGGTVPSDGQQNFRIEHTFPVLPFYTVGQLNNLKNNIPPSFLKGSNSLAYRFSLEMSTSVSTEESDKLVEADSPKGSIGFFSENFNGIQTQYSPESISYLVGGQPNDSLLSSGITDVTVIVNSADGTFNINQNVIVSHSYLPNNEDEYLNSQNFFEKNFAYDAVEMGSSGNIIKNVTTGLISANQLQINFSIDTTGVSQELTEESNYILYVILDDDGKSANDSDRTAVPVDINVYDKDPDIPDLFIVDQFENFDHVTDITATGNTDYKGWIQDGYAVKGIFKLDRSKFAVLSRLFIDIVAVNDSINESFTIQSNEFDLSNQVIVEGNQQINIQETQGFELDTLDQFNQKAIVTGAFDGTFIEYAFLLGLKINWQDWLSLPDADTIFYDPAQPNNGLNQNSSRYNLKEGYQLKTILRADVLESAQNITTEYITRSDLNALDFDEFSIDDWTGVITTKREDTGADTGGSILGSGNTTIITATFTPNFVITPDPNDYTGIIRIVEQLPQSDKTITELSSVRTSQPNNLLIPLDGEALTKVSVIGSTVVLECRTDKTLVENITYTLSARLLGPATAVIVGDFNDDFSNDFFV